MTALEPGSNGVAVIGLACRFPGAGNVGQFWRNLRDGVESISFFDHEELRASNVPDTLLSHPSYVPAKAILVGADLFDFQYFGIAPREAELMDPQHRVFLECACEALENAGYDFEERDARVGVYGGSAMSTYLLANVLTRPDLLESAGGLSLRLANGHDFLTTQVSYRLNLKGPSVTVQTACSTALVAVHLACQSVLDGECDMALAGGVAISFPLKIGYLYQEGSIWSPDGHCRPFDAGARGTVEGNGAGIVVLKRLEDALVDGDFIHAVILGSAVNNDGSLKTGYTAPSVETQTRVVAEALAMARSHPETIGYVEAHGSGTPLGDPIEVRALTQAYRGFTDKKGFCFLGSVKSNIGHLDNAAGIASLIKTILALKHRQIPPTLNFVNPNPRLELESSPFAVNARLEEWPRTNGRARAAVSALGIGGTNVHVVLEEAPARKQPGKPEKWNVLPLSALTPAALDTVAGNLAGFLQAESSGLSNAAYTLGVGRRQFKYRRVVVAETIEDACAALAHPGDGKITEARDRPVAFLFPGLGDHAPGLAAGLFHNEPGFRERMDECARILRPLLDADIREILFSPEAVAAGLSRAPRTDRLRISFSRQDTQPEGPLSRTLIAQPAVFAVEYALAGLLGDWGIVPDAMIGYSIGEYAAACVAGVFSLADALQLVAARARMIDALPASAMAAIPLAEEEVRELLDGDLSICVSNGPGLTVIGGPDIAVQELERKLAGQGIASRRLAASHAFHSALMDPIVEAFAREVARIGLHSPRIPFVSNVTGDWIEASEATDPSYWARHLRQTVRFGDGLEKILSQRDRILLEVGPGQALSTLTRQHPASDPTRIVIAAMRDRNSAVDDALHLRTALGRLWQAGARVDWARHWPRGNVQRVPLPTYPFERQRCWIEPGLDSALFSRRADAAQMDDRFYVPVWRPVPLPVVPVEVQSPQRWLIFADENGVGTRLAEVLRNTGHAVTTVRAGAEFREDGVDAFAIAPGNRADYAALMERLCEAPPSRVVHLWSAAATADLNLGFYSLLYFAQTLGEQSPAWPLRIDVVSSDIQDVTGEERIQPEKAAILGPLKVIPQEYAGVSCRHVDIDSANAEQLAREILSGSVDNVVAWRGRRRWVQTWSKSPLERPPLPLPRLKENGVYLIAGGLEGTGLIVAEHLARTARARLVLLGPESFPERDKWELWLQSHDDQDDKARAIRRLRAIEFSGCGLFIRPVDVVDEEAMRRAVEESVLSFGSINGVIHAAGPPGAGLIQLKTTEMAEAVLAPKLKGTMVLDRLTRTCQLDFFLVFSSLTALGGGLGQVDACAAGAFLDAYAHRHASDDGCFTGTINWSPFQWETWQVPALPGGQGIASRIQNTLESSGIGHSELADALDRILAGGLTQVAVCSQDLNQVLDRTNAMTASSVLESLAQARPDGAHGRPELAVAYQAPRNATEEAIAAVWAKSFGLERVGIHDGFFDLDGNSLLAIQIVTRLRTMFDTGLPMTALFDSPTVAGLARQIHGSGDTEERSEEFEALLGEIEQLSPADAEALLAGGAPEAEENPG